MDKADRIYVNGNVCTMDEGLPWATAIAVRGQELVCVGSDAGAMAHRGPGTDVVDLGGMSVVPGLIEGHMHLPGLGERLMQPDLAMVPRGAVPGIVRSAADGLAPGQWILGRGWNQESWADNAWPTRFELDAASPGNPVALTRVCGHAVWLNSAALKLAGITAETPDPPGGEILRDGSGEPIGILTDAAMSLVSGVLPTLSGDRLCKALRQAESELFANGITGCADAGSDYRTIETMRGMHESGELMVRLYAMVNGADADRAYAKGPEVGVFGERFTLRTVKLFADGSLGARSAWLLGDYADRPGHAGNPIHTDDALYGLVSEARDHGFQVATHAIGDAAVRQCLDTYERVLAGGHAFDHRWRIEHFQVVTLPDIDRLARLRAIPAMQAIHAVSDTGMAAARLGEVRLPGAYAWRRVIDAGSRIVNGSDAPVEPVNPFHGIRAAIAGSSLGQGMTRLEALKSFTVWAAYAQFEEGRKGMLAPGFLADFAVLDRDPLRCGVDELGGTKVLMTVCGGRVVYDDGSIGIGGGRA